MAREIRGVGSGTLYARVINKAGLWWNANSLLFEAYSAANYAYYVITMTQQGGSQVYVADFPTAITTGGTYEYYVHFQGGGSPAEGDQIIVTGKIDWTGTTTAGAASGSMTGSDFYDYLLRKGFKRTDKVAEVFEAVTDAIEELRRRFMFDEAEEDKVTTDAIAVLGDFKHDIESDLGLLLDVLLQDGTTGTVLTKRSKAKYDEMYPDVNLGGGFSSGYPRDYAIYKGQIYIGPVPDRTTYSYRLSYSQKGGTITSGSASVPFTNLYRDVLADLVLALLYKGLDEFDKADRYRQDFESGFVIMKRRENQNTGNPFFSMDPTGF